MHLAKSTIQGEEKKWSELSKEKEDLEAEVKTKLGILLQKFEKGKQDPKCMYHQILGKDLGTALEKLRNPEENNSKSNVTLLTILKNLCYQCLHVKDARYEDVLDDRNNPKILKTVSAKKVRPIKPKGPETVRHSLFDGLLVPPSETNKTNLINGTVMKKNSVSSDTDITIINTPSNSAPFTNKTNKHFVANKNLVFGNGVTHNNDLPSSRKVTTPYPVINVDAALNQGNDDNKCVNEEESEEKQKFKDMLFYDQAESGINIDDVL